ncbi:MAG TPA: group III truncated hemoglobin [Bacteroidia bacterium]|nr:group III truncated hemoglobin [Bacteroidia bacterium]
MRDIETRADIETLIHSFYSKLLLIEEIKVVFEGINFPEHVPHIVHFWSFVLLDEPGYTTNVFEKHTRLPIKTHQFDMWLDVFTGTVDELFMGEKANLAKQRATVLAHTFKSKWQHINGT